MKISDVRVSGVSEERVGEDMLEPRVISDDKPWVGWYDQVKHVPVMAKRFGGRPYDKLDKDQRLVVKNLHLEATKRKRTIDEAAADNIYIGELVELFTQLENAKSQAEADKIQRKVVDVLSKSQNPDELAADAFEQFTKSLQEQAAPATNAPPGGWKLPDLPNIQQFMQQRYGVAPGMPTMPPPANLNVKPAVPPGAAAAEEKAGSKVLGTISKYLKNPRAAAAAGAAATAYMLYNLFSGEQAKTQQDRPTQAAGTPQGSLDAAEPKRQAAGTPLDAYEPKRQAAGTPLDAYEPKAPVAVGPMSIAPGAQMPPPVQGATDKPMGTAIGAMPAAVPAEEPAPIELPRIEPAAPPPQQPIEQPRRRRTQPQFVPPVVPQVEPQPAPQQAPQQATAQEPAGQAEVQPRQAQAPAAQGVTPSGGGQPPAQPVVTGQPNVTYVPPPSTGDGSQPPPKPQAVTPSGQGSGDTVARAPQQSAPARQPAAAAPQAYSGITFKQAFARARERAEQLPDGDPSKYTFYWTNPKTGETKPYQTNYQGSGTRRRPEEPYIPQSRQRGTMSTEPIANPYENPDQFKGGRRRRRRRSTSESAAMMLRMRRHAPDAYGALIGDHGRSAVMEALAEIQGGGDITSRQLAELYILRARKHMDRVDDPHIMENASPSDIARAISHRLMHSGKAAELLRRHGLDKLMDAIGEVAEFHQGAEELGSSDISIMVGQVMDHLGEDDGRGKAYESSEDFITSIRDAVSKSVTGDSKGAAQALDKAKNAQQASNLPIAGNAGAPGNGTPAKPGTMADHIGKAMDASKKGDKRGMQTAIDAAKAVSAVSKANDPDNKKLLATLSESPANGDIVVMELADGRLLQARIAEASGRSLVVEMDETGLQWLDESPDHAALKIGSDGKRVSTIAERWNAMVDDLAHDTPQGWAAVFSKHAGRMGADAADMPRMWGKIWRQQHEKLGDSLTRQDQAEWSDEVSSSLHESAETNGQYMRHGLSHKDPAMLAVWMKSQSGVRGEPVKKFARGIAARSGEPDDAYWSKISGLVSEKQSQETLTDAEDMIAAGFSDDQIAKVTGLSHKHIRKLRAKVMDRPQEYRESSTGYSEPYEVGRKQGMHNIHSNPYSQGSPASQKWSAGHTAAVQGLGEEDAMEAGMPSSVAKHKKELNSKTPEELHARFRSVADRQGGASPERIEKLAREMAWRHGYGKMSDHYWKQFRHLVDSPDKVDEAVDKAQAERKLRNRYLGGDPKISWHRGYVKVVVGGKEYHHAVHKGQVEDRPYITSDMEEGKLDAARSIDRFFGGMAESLVKSVIRRAGILAMQGRHGEAESMLAKAMRDADPAAAKRVADAVRDIKPVTVGSRTADTSALEKSAEHTDWLDNTFIPWVMKGLGLNEAKYHGKEVKLGKPIRTNTSSGGKFKVYVRDPKTGNIKMVRFGDTTGLSIKRDDPKRRKSFRARHHCDNPGPRTKARYWSCRMWTRKPVGKILKGK